MATRIGGGGNRKRPKRLTKREARDLGRAVAGAGLQAPKRPAPTPRGDTKSDVHRPLTKRQAQLVRKAVRDTYREQTPERRRQISDASRRRPGPAAATVRKEHRSRVKAERLIELGLAYQRRAADMQRRGKTPVPSNDELRGLELARKVLPKRGAREAVRFGFGATAGLIPSAPYKEKQGTTGAVFKAIGAAAEPVGVRVGKDKLLKDPTIESQRKTLAGALWALDQLNRPLYGSATTARELVRGKDPISAAIKGAGAALDPTLDPEDKVFYSDVLKEGGVKNPILRYGGGFALDIAANPLSYLALGGGSAAGAASRQAFQSSRVGIEAAKREAVDRAYFLASHQGVTRDQATKMAALAARNVEQRLEREAADAARRAFAANSPHFGVTVGVRKPAAVRAFQNRRLRARTGQASARTERVSWARKDGQTRYVGSGVGGRISRSKVGQATARRLRASDEFTSGGAASELLRNVRPRDVSRVEEYISREIGNEARRARSHGESHARVVADGVNRALRKLKITPEGRERIALALDDGNFSELSDVERAVAYKIRRELDAMTDDEILAGFRQTVLPNYFPRVSHSRAKQLQILRRKGKLSEQEEKGLGTLFGEGNLGGGGRTATATFQHERKRRATLRQLKETDPKQYERYITDDITLPLLMRMGGSARFQALYRMQNRMQASLGREVTEQDILNIEQLAQRAGLFRRTRTGLVQLQMDEDDMAKAIERYLKRRDEGISPQAKTKLIREARAFLRATQAEARRAVREAERRGAKAITAATRQAGGGRLQAEREGRDVVEATMREAARRERQAARRGSDLELSTALEGGGTIARAERDAGRGLARAERQLGAARMSDAYARGGADKLALQGKVRRALTEDEKYMSVVGLEKVARQKLAAAKKQGTPAQVATAQRNLDEARQLRRAEEGPALERLTARITNARKADKPAEDLPLVPTAPAKPEPAAPKSKVLKTSQSGRYELHETPKGKFYVLDTQDGERLGDITSTGAKGGLLRSRQRADVRFAEWANSDVTPPAGPRYVPRQTENGQWRIWDNQDQKLRSQAVRFEGEAKRKAEQLNRDFADADWDTPAPPISLGSGRLEPKTPKPETVKFTAPKTRLTQELEAISSEELADILPGLAKGELSMQQGAKLADYLDSQLDMAGQLTSGHLIEAGVHHNTARAIERQARKLREDLTQGLPKTTPTPPATPAPRSVRGKKVKPAGPGPRAQAAGEALEAQGAREQAAKVNLDQAKGKVTSARQEGRQGAQAARAQAGENLSVARELARAERGAARTISQGELDAAKALLRANRVASLEEGRAAVRAARETAAAEIRAARELGQDTVKAARANLSEVSRLVTLPASDLQVVNEYAIRRVYEIAERGRSAADQANILARGFDHVQARLKYLQTLLNPPFYATNMLGDAMFFRLADGDWINLAKGFALGWNVGRIRKAHLSMERDLTQGFIRAGEVFDYPAVGKVSVLEMLLEGERRGVGGINYFNQEIRRQLDDPLHAGGRRGVLSQAGAAVNQFNQARERIARYGLFHDRLAKGDTFDEAADFVANALIDYSNLTRVERDVMRRLMPYYTFFSRNVALQSKGFVMRPGTYTTFESAREEAARAAGLEDGWEKDLPIYDQAGLPLPIPGLRTAAGQPALAYTKLPFTDLSAFTPTFDYQKFNLGSRASSVGRLPIELLMGKSFFFDADFAPRSFTPGKVAAGLETAAGIGPFGAYLFPGDQPGEKWAREKLVNRGPKFDPRAGKVRTGISTELDQILRLAPQYTSLLNLTGYANTPDDLQRRSLGAKATLISQVTGVRFGTYDRTLNARAHVLKKINEIEDRLKELRDERRPGKRTKAEKDLDKVQTKLEKMRNALESEAGFKAPKGRAPSQGRKRGGTYGVPARRSVYGVPSGGNVYGR